MNSFRLILDPPLKSTVNMAKDHAILHGLSMPGSLPTLRLYRWKQASVTLGYFQKIAECVNTSYCKKNGISVTRRETAGGTVMHHMELTYSFTLPLNSGIVPVSVEDSFRAIISPVIDSLRHFGINAEYRPVNDIVIDNRKISGSAQVRKKGVLQQHGTIILDIDKDIITSALVHDEQKLKKRGFASTHESVTSIRNETGKEIDEKFIDDLIVSLIQEFSNSFNIDFSISGLSDPEAAIMGTFSEKFASDQWNLKK
jgi:lipoate-protein ligase A